MFSLCIPTLNRYDKFLSQNLPKYIENDLIEEIIIQDENGNDIDKIRESGLDLSKVKLYKNESVLGPFLNKIKVCKKAKNEWIALIDSDNFADEDYFRVAKIHIEENNCNNLSILCPSLGKPNLVYTKYQNRIFKKNNLTSKIKNDLLFHSIMNTGNYIINKYLIDNSDLSIEEENKFTPFDVIYFNTLLFEKFDLELHIVKNLHYNHAIHNESIYHQNNKNFREFNVYIHNRFKRL